MSVTAHAGMAVPGLGAATPAAMAAAIKDCRFFALDTSVGGIVAPMETALVAIDCADASAPKGPKVALPAACGVCQRHAAQ